MIRLKVSHYFNKMSTQVLIFSDTRDQLLKIQKKDAIGLELKLNVSIYGHTWKDIGDILYNFGNGKNVDLLCNITDEQFDFLQSLNNPGEPE